MRSLPKVLGLLAVLLLTGLLTSQGLGAPFDDSDQGWGGAFYSLAARNLLRYPPDTTLLAMCVEPGALAPAPEVYFNHPPMVAWLVALSFSVFGEAEWAARLPLWLLSLGAAGALYGLLLRLGPRDGARERALWAAAGALAAVGCPAWVYYGSMVDPQGSGVLFAVALACLGAARWLEGGRRADAALCLGALGFGFLFDWPVYLAAAGLALGALRTGRRRAAAAVAGLTAAAAAGTAVWIAAAYGRMAAQFTIAEGFLNRTGLKETLADDTGAAVSAGQLIAGLLDHHGAAGWWPLSLAGAAAWGALGLGWWRGRLPAATGLALLPAAVGALHVLLFPQGAYVHLYWQLYLAAGLGPPLSLALQRWAPARWRRAALAGFALLVAAGAARGWLRAEVRWGWGAEQREVAREVGRALAEAVGPEVPVACPLPRARPPLTWYSDRKIRWNEAEIGEGGALLAPPGAQGGGAALPYGWNLISSDP